MPDGERRGDTHYCLHPLYSDGEQPKHPCDCLIGQDHAHVDGPIAQLMFGTEGPKDI